MKPSDHDTNKDTAFMRKVSAKADRKLKAQREGEHHVWQGLGMMGLVGWSIAVPVLIGLVAGEWLDGCCPGKYTWTLNLIIIGLFFGCINVCNWIIKEQRAINADKGDKHD